MCCICGGLKKKKEHKNLTVRKIQIMSLQFTQEIARTLSDNLR